MSSNHSDKESAGKSIPNWLLFLFFGAVVWGAVYGIFMHGFLGYSQSSAYRDSTGQSFAVAFIPEKPERNAASIANGEASASTNCGACHGGPALTGSIGPNLTDDTWLHAQGQMTETRLAELIMKGILPADAKTEKGKQGGMPPRGTLGSDRQVWEVIYYLSSKNRSIRQDATP